MRIGIDLGGTKTEGVLLDPLGNVVHRERRPTPAAAGYDAILGNILTVILALKKIAGQPCSIGIGTPGSLSVKTGLLKNSNTQALNGMPLLQDLQNTLRQSVRLQNDANCFALAEAKSGAGRGKRVVFGVILGTGVGGGIVIDGVVHDGPNHVAGEWGHNVLDPDGPACYCGKRGCVETLLSGPGLARDYGQNVEAPEIVARAERGDQGAKSALDRYVTRLGRALSVVVNILDPDIIVLGGGVSGIARLTKDAPAAVMQSIFNDTFATPIVTNELGDSAGVIGAAWLWPESA